MSKTFKKFFAGLLAFVLVFAMTAVAAPAKEAKAADGAETVAIGAEVSYTGLTTPGYTFDSSCLSAGKSVGAMVFNITVNLPAEVMLHGMTGVVKHWRFMQTEKQSIMILVVHRLAGALT